MYEPYNPYNGYNPYFSYNQPQIQQMQRPSQSIYKSQTTTGLQGKVVDRFRRC